MDAPRRRSSLSASLVAALLAAVVAGTLFGAGASRADRAGSMAFVQPSVLHTLAQEPTARVLVTLREPPALRTPRLDIAVLRAQVASTQARVVAALPAGGFDLIYRYHAVPALAGRVSASGLEALAQHPDVAEVTLDGRGSGALAQSVPLIRADELHAAGVTGAGIIVAVLDSGIDTSHPDLAGAIAYEACFLSEGGCPSGDHPAEDDHGHGTNVAGIITSDGVVAPIGVAPDARIAAYKVLDASDVGFFSDWTAALDDIIAFHPEVDIVNMSLQSAESCPEGPMEMAISTLRERGVPTFISAGNYGSKNSLTIPACIEDGLSVGAVYDTSIGRVDGWKSSCSDATTTADQVACWSDSDESLDLLAPGAAITSSGMGGGMSTFFGTSQAAPHAAGVAALLLEASPGLSADQIETRLEATGAPLTDELDDGDPSTNRITPRVDALAAVGGTSGSPAFRRGTLSVAIEEPTSLAFGPDGRLYAASLTEIQALTLDPSTKEVLAVEQIASGLVDVVGIAFDPTMPASPVTIYASRQDPDATPGFQGAVSRFTAPDWQGEDVITGLPTSRPNLNHLTNGLAFDEGGRLFIAQGSTTDAGLADPPGAQEYWPESPLSAAILVADIHAPDFDGAITYDPPGEPLGDTVDQVSGDVAVYAPGLRNAYDLVTHSNGFIYAADNGAMGKEVSLSCTTSGGLSSVADELNLIEEGRYYGFPNRNRGRLDPRQCAYHAPEEVPGSGDDFAAPIALLPDHCSCDGMAEYTAAAFGGAMLGDLVYAEHMLGNVARAVLSQDGRSVLSTSVLASGFRLPLDVAVGPDGTIYVAEYGASGIAYLAPDADPPTPTPTPTSTLTPTPTATATSTPTVAPPPNGDVDCDGTANSIDAALVLQLDAGLIASLVCQEAADVNGDDAANALDAALILQAEAGLVLLPG